MELSVQMDSPTEDVGLSQSVGFSARERLKWPTVPIEFIVADDAI